MPRIIETGFYTASAPFYHMDRTADFHVFLLVVEGVIYVTEKNIDYEIRPGESFVLKANINHFGRFEIPKGTRWYFIHFKLPQKIKKSESKSVVFPKKIFKILGTDIEKDVGQIVDDFHSQSENIQLNINSRLYLLFLQMIEFSREEKKVPSLSQRICDFLEEHISDEFSVEDLENTFCLSYKRLAAVFKLQKNTSMKKYHNELKIKLACRLIQTTLKNFSEISQECGFSDPLYFSKVFKQFTGKSPSQWRKSVCY